MLKMFKVKSIVYLLFFHFILLFHSFNQTSNISSQVAGGGESETFTFFIIKNVF